MNCVKCGQETEAEEVFCAECLEEMKKYPVRPNTLVQIPHRPKAPAVKKTHVRRIPAEEQIATLRWRCRALSLALAAAVLVAAALAVAVGITVYELDVDQILGQNYSTVETTPADGSR